MASPLSAGTDTLDAVDSFDLSEHHSEETKMDEQSGETTDSVQQGVQLISKQNTKYLKWKYFGFTQPECDVLVPPVAKYGWQLLMNGLLKVLHHVHDCLLIVISLMTVTCWLYLNWQ